jgi:hypothetical protein
LSRNIYKITVVIGNNIKYGTQSRIPKQIITYKPRENKMQENHLKYGV